MIEMHQDLPRLLESGLNDGAIARFLCMSVADVTSARKLHVDRGSKPAKTRSYQPPIPPLRGNEGIQELADRGLSGRKIAARLGLSITPRQINRITAASLTRPYISAENTLHSVRPYVDYCLQQLGLDPYYCMICEEFQESRCLIHHTKYQDATIYDLVYACASCNNSRANRGLA